MTLDKQTDQKKVDLYRELVQIFGVSLAGKIYRECFSQIVGQTL